VGKERLPIIRLVVHSWPLEPGDFRVGMVKEMDFSLHSGFWKFKGHILVFSIFFHFHFFSRVVGQRYGRDVGSHREGVTFVGQGRRRVR
jgi:hypothetical protein